MEHEIKLLKDREVDQKNKASGYETLLRDGIPLNEHFLALKNKFNNEQDPLKKGIEVMDDEIRREENINKERNHKINILKDEYETVSQKYKDYKYEQEKKLRDLEFKLYNDQHTKDTLYAEKQDLSKKVNNLKADNQEKNREITKDKYQNKREEEEKKNRKLQEEVKLEIDKMCENIET